MKASSDTNEIFYLGVDGGGSKSVARLVSSRDGWIGTGTSGAANPFTDYQGALHSIREAALLALDDAGLPGERLNELVAGVGLAGVNVPSMARLIEQWQHPFKGMYLTTDLEIACLGAHQGGDGAVIIAGTGSVGVSVVDGNSLALGGHGFQLGDKGGGAWTGLEAIKAVLLAGDGLGPATVLATMLEQQLQASGLGIVEKMAESSPDEFARLAPLVLEAASEKDDVAMAILFEGGGYLSDLAAKLWQTTPPRMSMIGGFSDAMLAWMDKSIAQRMSPVLDEPEMGAVYFAQLQSKLSSDKRN